MSLRLNPMQDITSCRSERPAAYTVGRSPVSQHFSTHCRKRPGHLTELTTTWAETMFAPQLLQLQPEVAPQPSHT